MAQDPQNESPENPRDGEGGGGGFNWRGMLLLMIAFLFIALAFIGPNKLNSANGPEISYFEFKEFLKEGKVYATEDKPLRIVQHEGRMRTEIAGYYLKDASKTEGSGKADEGLQAFHTLVDLKFAKDDIWALLGDPTGESTGEPVKSASGDGLVANFIEFETRSDWLPTLMVSFLPIVLLLVILYFLFRHQMRMAGRGAMSFGKSKAKMMSLDKNKITFKNVAGVEEAKEEVWEIVRVPQGSQEVSAPRWSHSQGRPHGWSSWNGQDSPGPCHCGRSRCSLLQH